MSNFVPAVAPTSKKEIEVLATRLLCKHYPRLLRQPAAFPVLEFFDHVLREYYELDTGVEVLSDGVEGVTLPDGQVLVSEETYRSAHMKAGRGRFTVIHECCHGLMHSRQIQRAIVDRGELVLHRRRTIEPYRDPEWQANYYAGAILMPHQMVVQLAKEEERFLLPSAMADVFGVSRIAAEVRIDKLGI